MRQRRTAGLSLLEVMIASIILFVVVAISMSILFTATTAVNEGSRASGLQHRGRMLVEFCRDQFYVARFRDPVNSQLLGLYDQNTQLRFQMPVRREDTGAMSYGYSNYLGNDPADTGPTSKYADKVCVLRFEADTIYQESSSGCPSATQIANPTDTTTSTPLAGPLPPLPKLTMVLAPKGSLNVVNKDIDGNKVKFQTFVQGKIKQYVITAAHTLESTAVLDDKVILGVDLSGTFNGRVSFPTGAGTDNPNDSDTVYRGDWLFRYVSASGNTDLGQYPATGNTPTIGMVVTVWHGDWDENRKGFLIWRDRETIRFRNTQ